MSTITQFVKNYLDKADQQEQRKNILELENLLSHYKTQWLLESKTEKLRLQLEMCYNLSSIASDIHITNYEVTNSNEVKTTYEFGDTEIFILAYNNMYSISVNHIEICECASNNSFRSACKYELIGNMVDLKDACVESGLTVENMLCLLDFLVNYN